MNTRAFFGFCGLLCGVMILLTGCSKPADAPQNAKESATPQKSTAQTAIDGVTGKTAIEAGKRAEKQLDGINAKREEDIKELESF